MLLHTSLWLQWLLCITMASNWLITLHILLIWHHLTIFFSQHEKMWLWSSIVPMMRSYVSAVENIFLGSGWEPLYHENPSAATLMEEVCELQGRLLKNKPRGQIWPLHHSQPMNFSAHPHIMCLITYAINNWRVYFQNQINPLLVLLRKTGFFDGIYTHVYGKTKFR